MQPQSQLDIRPGTGIRKLSRGVPLASEALAHLVERICFELGLPQGGRDYVAAAIALSPTREGRGYYGNVITRYRSPKAGDLWLESRSGEFALALLLDADDSVLAYFAQPPQLFLTLRNEQGVVTTRTGYTPDFLVIRKTGFTLIEQRDEGALAARAFKNPYQFFKDDNHRWHYRAAEEEANSLGILFQISSNFHLPVNIASNARFLEEFLLETAPPLPPVIKNALVDALANLRAIRFRDLRDVHKFSADHIFAAIASGDAYVDLLLQRLDHADELVVFSDALICHASLILGHAPEVLPVPGMHEIRSGTQFRFDGVSYRVLLCGELDVKIINERGEMRTLGLEQVRSILQDVSITEPRPVDRAIRRLDRLDESRLARALARLDAVRAGHADGVAKSTIEAWGRRYRKYDNSIDGFLELVDDYRDRGNRKPRLRTELETLAAEVIQSFFNQPRFPNKRTAYAKYVSLCSARFPHDKPMSEVTFGKRCAHYLVVRDREGTRAAYQKNPIRSSLNTVWPVHGCRPHEYLYIDSTPLDLTAMSPRGINLAKPYGTFGLDGATGRSMAFVCTFDAPSAQSVLLTLRDYVRRHRRLPRTLSVDNGPEFRNVAVERFCKLYGLDLRFRAPARPRGGAPIERVIGATTDEVLSFMEGNTRNLRDNRLGTRETDPFLRTEWTLTAIYHAIDDYLMKVRNARPHHAIGLSPDQLWHQMLADTGEREHNFVAFDENLMLATCSAPKRRFHKYSSTHGIWCNHRWYRCRKMDDLANGAKVEIKFEPWIDDVIYVQIEGDWHAAVCRDSRVPFVHTSKEVATARRRERDVVNLAYRHALVSGPHLFNKSRYEYPSYFDPRLREKQGEMRHLYFSISMGVALPNDVAKLIGQQQAEMTRCTVDPAAAVSSVMDLPAPSVPVVHPEEPKRAAFMSGLKRLR